MAILGLFTLAHKTARDRAIAAVANAPEGARVKIEEPARTLDQNAKLWPMLADIALQIPYHGEYRTPDEWKGLFMHACGKEVRFLPALDGKGFVPFGMSSSKLGKSDFSQLIEYIICWGAENDIKWSDPSERVSPRDLEKEGGSA